jgi:5-methylcytosine-specific restriction endonuclease McrA
MAITNGHQECLFCKSVFEVVKPWQKYCSYQCQYTHANSKKKRGITNKGFCARCRKSLEHKKSHAIYCSMTCKSMDHNFKHRSKTRTHGVARRREIYDRDNGSCYLCFTPISFESFELDHLVPVSRAGSNAPENLAVCCLSCNRSRGTKLGIRQLQKLFELRPISEHN